MRKTTTYAILGALAAVLVVRGANRGLFGADVQRAYLEFIAS
jgi:hypothetical protein